MVFVVKGEHGEDEVAWRRKGALFNGGDEAQTSVAHIYLASMLTLLHIFLSRGWFRSSWYQKFRLDSELTNN